MHLVVSNKGSQLPRLSCPLVAIILATSDVRIYMFFTFIGGEEGSSSGDTCAGLYHACIG